MRSRINARHVRRMVDATMLRTALQYERELRDFLNREHRRSGLLANSLRAEVEADGASVASDVPYARFFEAQTGAVGDFSDEWVKRGGSVAAAAGKLSAAQALPR